MMSEHKQPKKRIPLEKPQQVVPRQEDLEKLRDTKIPTRRVKMLMVNPVDFVFLFTKGLRFRKNYVLVEGVPEDAKVITAVADSARNGIMMVVQSEEYDEVPINVMPPVQPISIDMAAVDTTKRNQIPKRKQKKQRK
jgi:hypothetical protein